MARFMRTDLGPHHSQLHPPAVVGEGIVFPPIQGCLFPISDVQTRIRKHTVSRLRPPTVVTQPQPFVARPVLTHLAASAGQARQAHTKLRPPRVINVPPPVYGPSINLAPRNSVWRRSTQRSVQYKLSPPILTVSRVFSGPSVRLAKPIARRSVRSTYVYPIVVFREQALGWVAVQLVQRPRPKTTSRLSPPASTAVAAQVYYGPKTPFVRVRARRVESALRAPTVVFLAVEVYGPVVTLARNKPKPTTRFLRPPTVVFLAVEVYGPEVTLVQVRPQPTTTRLSAPTVVFTAVEIYGPTVELAYSVRKRGVADLKPPTLIDLSPQVYYLSVTLAPSKRGVPKSDLRAPAVISTDRFFGPAVHLAPSRRPKARYGLAAPAVVFIAEPVLYPVSVTLAYSLRGKAKPFLGRPTVVGAVVYFGPAVNLTYSRRGTPKSVLRKPTVIDLRPQTYYLTVSLAYSRRGVPKSRLEPPTVIDVRVYTGPSVTLAYSRRGAPKSVLRPPVIPPLAEPTRVTLAYSRRGTPLSVLSPPTVIDNRPQTYYLAVNLAYSRRGRPVSFLKPPTVVDRRVYFGPEVKLTYSRRGRPVYELKPPTVIDLRPQTYYLAVTLAPSRRGRPMHFLRPAILAQAKQYDAVFVHLAYSVRKRGRAVLRRPVVVFPFFARKTQVTLAPQSRGVAKSQLLPPAVIRERENRPLTIVFVRTRPRPTTRFLRPPTVVRVPENRPTRVTLTRIAPRPTVALLKPPTVVFYQPVETTVRTWLTYQTRGVTGYGLAAPAIINPAPLAEPTQVTLVRIRPPERFWRLFPPAVVGTFVPPHGDVCGFDVAGSFVCDSTTAEIDVCGTDEAGSAVTGSDHPESRITGTDNAVGEVCGTDEQAT